MRMNGHWMPVTLVSFAAFACSPHVSVGDLGSESGASSMSTAGAMNGGDPGGATSVGGASMQSHAGANDPGTSTGGALSMGTSTGGAPSMSTSTGGTPSMGTSTGGAPSMGDAGGAVSAGAAGVGGSMLPPGCPADLHQVLPAKTADCPDAPVSGACDWTENAICVWQESPTQAGFTAQGCYAGLMGKVAYGLSQVNLGDVGMNNGQCPKIAPEPNSSCAMHEGQHCYYPYGDCACAAGAGNWQCHDSVKVASPPVEVKRLCVPMGIDESKQLKDLSDQELLAWCNWYGDPSGAARPKVSPQDSPDMAESYGSIYTFVGVKACILDLPSELCVKNIRTQPACSATIAQLDDCIETMRASGVNGFVGHGCGPLLANATCSRVIAQPIADDDHSPSGCKTPLK